MKLTEMLMDIGRPVAYFPKLNHITGGVKETLFLCQLLYWEGKQRSKDGWICKTVEEMTEETGLSRREQERARKVLREKGFIEEKLAQVPRRLHYKVMFDCINEAWDEYQKSLHQTDELESQNDSHTAPNSPPIFTKQPLHIPPNSHTITENTQEITTENTLGVASPTPSTENDKSSTEETVEPLVVFGGLDKPSKVVKAGGGDVEDIIKKTAANAVERRNAKKAKKKNVPRKPVQNVNTIIAHFRESFKDVFNGTPPLERAKDKALMKQMIDHYGYDMVIDMMDWMFRNYAKFVRDCKIKGVPTLGMFYGFRSYWQEQIMYKEDHQDSVGDNDSDW